ncbi:asparagine synthase (glutamine-hydrolyzing) [Magnetococcales bacterium HHB-1]
MCGILGTVGTVTSPEKLLETLQHRGPDSQGDELIQLGNHKVWFAHTRLSILDLSPAGHQPMISQDGRWWITYNGEVYNHQSLRKMLKVSFQGHSDTETIVEYLARFGIERTLPKLNGMFAFAALDTQQRKLYLVRDPFGIKPLYYTAQNKKFAFASEVRALKKMDLVSGLDQQGLASFLTLRYVPSPQTLWQGIKRLPPGHLLSFDLASEKRTITRYTTSEGTPFTGTMDEAITQYKTKLREAIHRQLLSDVPVGILLSGGIDSALVAAVAQERDKSISCFSVGFGADHDACEIEDAAETARFFSLPFFSTCITPEGSQHAFEKIAEAIEEPLGTTSVLPMWFLVQQAREQVTVVLTGQGSDEPWGGYRRYQVEMLHQALPWLPLWRTLHRAGKTFWPMMPDLLERGLRTLKTEQQSHRIQEACALFPAEIRQQLIGSDDDGGTLKCMEHWLEALRASRCHPAEQMMRLDSRMNLSDDLLLYGDKISMAFALETRVPMLDIELVRFVESLPLSYRLAWRKTKIVHKKMAERYLPTEIVHRRKKGFLIPFSTWSRGVWRDWIESLLLDASAPHLNHLNRQALQTLWQQHLSGKRDSGRQIFSLMMLASWWKNNRF